MYFDPAALAQELKRNVVEIRFTKADGTYRRMRCTLKPDFLPQREMKEGDEMKSPQLLMEETAKESARTGLFKVWDIDQAGWRSFHISTADYVQTVDTI
jgi:hypothetical protein